MRGCAVLFWILCTVAEVIGSYYLADTHPVIAATLALSALTGVISVGVRLIQEADK